jgi:signal transduction histidine kinase
MKEADFEKCYSLSELLPSRSFQRLSSALTQMGLDYFDIVDTENNSLLRHGKNDDFQALTLAPELEPIGYIRVSKDNVELGRSAVSFILEILQTNWRYQMASSIHIQTTTSDYDALVKKNELLSASEERYKALSEHLEERVDDQIKVIEDSQRQLYEAEKMASVGQLAAGIAHEINNPIGFISCNINTGQEYLTEIREHIKELTKGCQQDTKKDDCDEMTELLDDFDSLLNESSDGAQRVTAIVADLKAFSNIDHSEEVLVNLQSHVERVARIFLTSVDAEVELVTNIHSVDKTFCKPGHINQLLLNLLHNAADAISSGGKITLTCKMEDQHILLGVSDTGVGMSEESKKKAFEPFYTTREVGSGTGLGLTVSRDIVNAHNGIISIQSKLGIGTVIQIKLPITSEPAR